MQPLSYFRSASVFGLLAWVAVAAAIGSAKAAPSVDFNRDVKPILSNKCFFCHGPDANQRKGGTDGLRLDMPEGATSDLGGYAAIVPGHPEKSALVKRITATDPDEVMPPMSTGKKLSAREIAILMEWVRQGGKYSQHWSYAKPARPDLPAVKNGSWPRNEIDRFILARLDREGLKPSAEADRYALIRRLSLDLTGLPPTLEEVDAFVADADPKAYENLVERLLAKEVYGEHWAYLWLDLARYADSAGYADDPPRSIWLFRDYVIQALNANKPFDQFTIEQIAGDLLPKPTEQQLIATAFHRNTLTNNEGGTNDEEFRNVAIVDRVNTTMAVWMGTTIACAQCHNHKYDAISQEEFFRLFAFFNNTEDADRKDETPVLSLYTPEQERQRGLWQEEIAGLETTLKTPTPALKASQAKWETALPLDLKWQALDPQIVISQAGLAVSVSDGALHVPAGAKNDTYTVIVPLELSKLQALRLEALPDDSLPGKGPGHADGNFIVTRISAALTPGTGANGEKPQGKKPIDFNLALADFSQSGFEAENVLKNPDPKKKGWAIGGQTGKPHSITLVTAAPLDVPEGSTLFVTIEHGAQLANQTLGHFRVSATDDSRAAEWARTPQSVLTALAVPVAERSPEQQDEIAKHYVTVAPELQPTRERLAALKKQLADSLPTTVPVMRDLPGDKRRETKIQHRGNFLDLGPVVNEGTPTAFPPLPKDAPRNRLSLARWLVDDNNPLTARVIANRYWEQIFGIGIVASSEEFGSQGDSPSHPELLDWMATELVRQGWDQKAFLRTLVTSAAYRQSSQVTPELQHRDPDNRLLARGPRVRLSAEMIRDQALFVGGLLSPKMFGPPVKPPQPSIGLNAAFGSGIDWQTSAGEDRYRRALYTTWRRSNPYPSMATFDAPNREVCTVRRVRTNTPLQALVTLNDPVYVEASQSLARRIMAQGGGTSAERLRYGFRLCLSRPPNEAEAARLLQLFEQARGRFEQRTEEARRLATEPLGPAPSGMNVSELAAWTVVGNVVLNLDETMMKR